MSEASPPPGAAAPPPLPGPYNAAGEPVCPRHPDRVAYVRCQRCERPVCPQCQRPAAVGVQCVDCVKEAARATPATRTAFGGTARAGRPVVTIAIMVVCVVIWLAQRGDSSLTDHWAFAPYAARARPWTFLTAAFLHSPSNVLHIASNMYALWICGQYLEPLLGRARFLALYLVSALGGSVGMLLLATPQLFGTGNDSWWTPGVGASGAVFGLFSALVVMNRKLGVRTVPVFALIGINLVLSFTVSGISWQAHVGGLVTGAVVSAALIFAPRERRTQIQWGGIAGVLVLLLALTVFKFSTVPADVAAQAAQSLNGG